MLLEVCKCGRVLLGSLVEALFVFFWSLLVGKAFLQGFLHLHPCGILPLFRLNCSSDLCVLIL